MRFINPIAFLSLPLLVAGFTMTGCASSSSTDAASARTAPGPQTVEASNNEASPIEASSAVLRVKGMSCPKCANNITLKLKEVRGVDEVLINMGIGEVIVSFREDPHPSREQLASAISSAGFTLESITAR